MVGKVFDSTALYATLLFVRGHLYRYSVKCTAVNVPAAATGQ